MATKKKKDSPGSATIAQNKKARHDYHIEQKLEAEQQAQRMEFVLDQAKREADQKRIEAEGIRDAQMIIAEGLTPAVLRYKSIEAFLELAKSPNTKIIVSDGDLPIMLDDEGGANPSTVKMRR